MTPRLCKYLCGTMLDGFDEQARKYIEATGGLHTKERCQEAKSKKEQKGQKTNVEAIGKFAEVIAEDKDDHGNESYATSSQLLTAYNKQLLTASDSEKFVDHTAAAKGASKVEIFFGMPGDVKQDYNEFLKTNNGRIKTQGAHDHVTKDENGEPLLFSIFLYYEETKQ